ncbi:NHL repeat-containing protein [Mucilaginibacter sp. L3T2-6]|uniref:NHL repeat-containing protein n=1 Tax=Mucilaginibacter sp. L3T2-6 TaxID=3062491 RepID=UPI00267597FA|nr:NHL repeat-containing protein [Mucilaginibacter sp. L3T2-6]MDO3642355.1 NHL repeat-containing protein [Mucilaginibacter sp. L3T2-6]MDV6214850.1 NHL repeat-containing protein [Mucilaginibacter sp. L3T2-6]
MNRTFTPPDIFRMTASRFQKSLFSVLFLSLVILISSCKKKDTTTTTPTSTLPTVTTAGLVINLTSTTAQAAGTVSEQGSSTITEAGICYSATNKTPVITDAKVTGNVTNPTYPIDFTADLTGLTAGTVYYARAFATNSSGTAYGSVITFTTSTGASGFTTTVSTFAGTGTAGSNNGDGIIATFNNPQGVAVDASGKVYVSDSFNNSLRVLTAGGITANFAGNGTLGYQDGNAAEAEFYGPHGLAVDGSGNIYVADLGNNVIRKITPAGVVSTFAGSGVAGFTNATGTAATFNNPSGVAVDAAGNVYVADYGNNAIRKITPAGVVTTLAGFKSGGFVNGTGTAAGFKNPNGVAVDASGNIYVADQGNSAIRKVTADGVVTTVAGGPSQTQLLNFPVALALDKDGNIYVADETGRIIICTTTNVLYVLAGTAGVTGFTNGDGATATFYNPQGIAVDASGNIYVADQNNNAIRKLTVVKK